MNKFISYLKSGGTRLVIARLLGCFLLVTAALKIHGLWVDPYGQENFLALPWLQWLTIEVEVLLGLWLLSGVANRLALIVSLGVFTIFAALSFTLAWQGQTDCGCFGNVKVNPWLTFGLDVVVVITIAVTLWRASSTEDLSKARLSGFLMSCLQVVAITAVMLGLIAISLTIYAGDVWAGLAKLRGDMLTVSPAVTELGEGLAGELRTINITLHNHDRHAINVIGGTANCTCVTTKNLPIIIPAKESRDIQITIKYKDTSGIFSTRFTLFSDQGNSLLFAWIRGQVIPKKSTVIITKNLNDGKPL